ncbi:MAG: NAD(P)H-dependent oxidoreductase subunit E [Saprospiraceae bacterium]|nr:NAD(P)H-dependent oxidoreductase subunit E [Saprospiraceae bacterium]
MPDHKYLFPAEPGRSRLLGELWHCQQTEGYISDAAITRLAEAHNVSTVAVEGVSSFYHFFHRTPGGRHTIYLNNSIIAEMNGFESVKNAFEKETGARTGSVDPTGAFGFFTTPCIGLSDQEPAALIDFHPFTHLTAAKVKDIVQQLRQGRQAADLCDAVPDNIRYLPANNGSIFFAPYTPGEAVGVLPNLRPEGVISLIREAAIAGRGGAFFPTWRKWEACRKQTASPKFIICNADEGEPGTFKDRVLLNNQTGSVLEGMIIAGYTVDAPYGIIYLRGEYRWLAQKIQQTIDDFKRQGILGNNAGGIEGFHFDIRIEIGAGSYVCGEETALFESLEGKRGEPRVKWLFPVEQGYLHLPTVINNVETFSTVARLLPMGISEYSKRGMPGAPGTKLISISGDCRLPGVYEIEWGTTVGALLNACQANDPYLIQLTGPSGNALSLREKDRRISMPGTGVENGVTCGGAFMVFGKQTDLLGMLLNFAGFFKHESCGICTPCRAGNFIIQRKLEQLFHGTGDLNDLEDLKKWARIMESASRCGLGRTAGHALMDTFDKFSDYFADRVPAANQSGVRSFDMEAAEKEYEKFKPSAP